MSVLTILEQAKRRELGNIAIIAELLNEYNELTIDAPTMEANDVYSHLYTKRVALPTIGYRNINEGATKSSSKTVQVREPITLLEVWAEIDEQLIDHEPNPSASRQNELVTFIEAGAQAFAEKVFYGKKSGDARQFDGLATRFGTLSDDNVTAPAVPGDSANIQSSVWMIEWGVDTAHLVFPKGASTVGLSEQDMGKMRVTDGSNNPFMAYVNQLKWEYGLVIKDDRAVQRICNLETADDTKNFVADGNVRTLVKAKNQLTRMGRNAVIYCNRETKATFDIYAMEKANGFYYQENITGGPLTTFQGIPIRMVEQLLNTEAVLS